MKRSHLDIAFAVVTTIIATGFFRFIAVPFGIPIYFVSGVLLLFNSFYFVANIHAFRFNNKRILLWVLLLLIWPLFSFMYSVGGDLRSILILLNSFLIFSGISILIQRGHIIIVHKMLSASLVVTYLGAVLNLMRPDLFTEVARLADAYVLTMGRPGGFHLQPNDLAINSVLIFAAKLALDRDDHPIRDAISSGLVVLIVLLSGSRAGLMTVAIVLELDSVGRLTDRTSRVKIAKASISYLGSLVIMMIGVFFLAKSTLSFLRNTTDVTSGGLVDRLDAFLSFRLSYDGAGLHTQSITDRWEAQLNYLRLIAESPVTGHGIGSEQLYLATGGIPLSSHSSFLSMSFEYGVPYAFVFVLALVSFIFISGRSKMRIWVNMQLKPLDYWSFAILSLLLLFYSGTLVGRIPFVILVAIAVTPMLRVSAHIDLQKNSSRRILHSSEKDAFSMNLIR